MDDLMVADRETGEVVRLPNPGAPPVQVALAAAAASVGAIPKDDMNAQQGFKYRGIERILQGVGPALHKHGVVVLPRVMGVERETMERGNNHAIWRLVTLTVEYVFVGPAGDSLTAVVLGEGLDNGDKAVSKALTMAYKSALLQCLQIADAESDADATTPPEQAPAAPPPAFLSTPNVEAAQTKANAAGMTADDVAEMVLIATNNRTAVLGEVFANEVRQLRDAMAKVLAERDYRAEVAHDGGEGSAHLGYGNPPPDLPDNPEFDVDGDGQGSNLPDVVEGLGRERVEQIRAAADPNDDKPMTPKMKAAVFAILAECGRKERPERLAALSAWLGRGITSTNDLTASEAGAIISATSVAK